MEVHFKLYSYWRSSSSWRVRLALAKKGLPYEYEAVHLLEEGGRQHTDEYIVLNSMRQVPTLKAWINGPEAEPVVVTQSMAIMEFVEELFPTPSILPDGAAARAQARSLAEVVNSGIQPLQNLALIQHLRDELEVDAREFCRHWIRKGLFAYQQKLAGISGDFSVGHEPTIADFCLLPQLYNARRFKIDLEPFELLTTIEANLNDLDFAAEAHPDAQPDADPNASP